MHIDFGQNYYQASTVIAHYSKIFFSPTYLFSSQTANYDWAFGILDGYYGNTQGYLGIIKYSSASLSINTQLVVDGYYNAYIYQSLSYGDYLTNEGNAVIRYQKVTSSGDSGAPVFSTVDNKIVCIHCGSVGDSYSFGTAFESDRFSLFYGLFTGVVL